MHYQYSVIEHLFKYAPVTLNNFTLPLPLSLPPSLSPSLPLPLSLSSLSSFPPSPSLPLLISGLLMLVARGQRERNGYIVLRM